MRLQQLLLGVVFWIAAIATASGNESTADEAAVVRGRALFAAVGCYQCHGFVGQGGAAGPRIGGIALPFVAFSAFVRRPGGEMPAYTANVLSENDLRAIFEYVRALPQPVPAKSTANSERR